MQPHRGLDMRSKGKVKIQLGEGSAAHVADPATGGGRRTGTVRGGGRRRIPMAKIASLQGRRVCFAKRRQGFFRRCTALCRLFPGYQISAVAFSPDVGTPFSFAVPSSSSSPADMFRRLLSEVVDVDGPTEVMVKDDGAHHHVSCLSSSSSPLDDEPFQTILDDKRAEFDAALQWADSIIDFSCDSFTS